MASTWPQLDGLVSNRSRLLAMAVLLVAGVAFGCASPSPAPKLEPSGVYRVGAPDVLTITVLPEPAIERQAIVRPDGMISIDLIGDVPAAGRTPEEIAADVEKRISKYKRGARATVAVDHDSALARVALELGRQISSSIRIDLATNWRRGIDGFSIDFGVTTSMPTLRAISRNRYTPNTGVEGINFAEGSIVWNRPSQRLVLGNGRSLGRAGLVGEVFLDENGNGVRDAAEFGVSDIVLRAGAHRTNSDCAMPSANVSSYSRTRVSKLISTAASTPQQRKPAPMSGWTVGSPTTFPSLATLAAPARWDRNLTRMRWSTNGARFSG